MADYDYLDASNGSGDAALMHITAARLTGSTSLAVDSVANVPTKFIASTGTLGSNGLITGGTLKNFKGHVSGSSLVIDAFEPGSTDAGSSEGDVVIIKPTTGWTNRVAAFIQSIAGITSAAPGAFTTLAATVISATSATLTGNATVGGNLVVTGTTQHTSAGTASGTTITPTTQVYNVTALAANATIAVPSFASFDGAVVVLRIKDNGTSRTLTFASGYTNQSGVSTPTATTISKLLTVGAMYSTSASKWQIIAITQES